MPEAESNISIMPFLFEDEHLVRVRMNNDDPWFATVDVCKIFEVNNSRQAASRLDPDEKMTFRMNEGHAGSRGGAQSMAYISESGLYALAFSSRTPSARRFCKWVTSEVLPAIRRTGRFGAPDPVAPDFERVGREDTDSLKLRKVAECRQTHGIRAAQQMWLALGLEHVPAMDSTQAEIMEFNRTPTPKATH